MSEQKEKNKQVSGEGNWAVGIGSIVTLIWVAFSFYAFWIFYNFNLAQVEVENLNSEVRSQFVGDLIGSTAWPFAVVFLSVPLLFMFILGGFRALRVLTDLRGQFTELPENIVKMQDLKNNMETLGTALGVNDGKLDKIKSSISSELSEAIPSAISNALAGLSIEPRLQSDRLVDIVEELDQLYIEVKWMYSELLDDFMAKTGDELETSRGWLSRQHVDTFKEHGLISDKVRTYMHQTLEVEAKTRRSARKNLEINQVKELNSLRKSAFGDLERKFEWIEDQPNNYFDFHDTEHVYDDE